MGDRDTLGRGSKLCVSLLSGVIAGVAAAIISHPADTLLSKINKAGAGGEGSMFVRLGRIAGELGFVKLALVGLPARCVMIGGITAGQFGIFDSLLPALGVEKFHFHDSSKSKSGKSKSKSRSGLLKPRTHLSFSQTCPRGHPAKHSDSMTTQPSPRGSVPSGHSSFGHPAVFGFAS